MHRSGTYTYLGMVSTSDPVLCFCDGIELRRDLIYEFPTLISDKDLGAPIATHHLPSYNNHIMDGIIMINFIELTE